MELNTNTKYRIKTEEIGSKLIVLNKNGCNQMEINVIEQICMALNKKQLELDTKDGKV